ncbi:MAG: hypothetical protein MJ252_21460 [archaeon]|nr:hypothetical protein [archaeon]
MEKDHPNDKEKENQKEEEYVLFNHLFFQDKEIEESKSNHSKVSEGEYDE